jgi:hypothetical protein
MPTIKVAVNRMVSQTPTMRRFLVTAAPDPILYLKARPLFLDDGNDYFVRLYFLLFFDGCDVVVEFRVVTCEE